MMTALHKMDYLASTQTPSTTPLSTASLLAFLLQCEGLPASITFSDTPPSPTDSSPEFSLILNQPVPLSQLLPTLRQFRNSSHLAALLIAPMPSADAYSEQLLVGPDHYSVLRIERHYHRPTKINAHPRQLLGLVLKSHKLSALTLPPHPKIHTLIRHIFSKDGSLEIIQLPPTYPPLTSDHLESEILAYLSADDRAKLAQSLNYRQFAPDCFASPQVIIPAQACLKPPLFIDAEVQITSHDVHIGPAWLHAHAPAVTVAASATLADDSAPSLPPPLPVSLSPEYFASPITPARPIYDKCKRLFDFCFSLFWLIVLSPIMIIAALIVKLTDGGSFFFIHEREGLHARPFGCIKFRTMIKDAHKLQDQLRAKSQVDGPQFKIDKDPRITLIGRFLRKTNIDELPQLLNVLRGEMSIVGPRPSPFKENQLCPPWREARLSVKPGITGLWQVSRSHNRGDTDFQEWIYYDTQYVQRRSFWLDLKIILLTVKEILGKGQ